jgi:hypothetical protein
MIYILLLGNNSIGRLKNLQQFTDEANINEKLISSCDTASWNNNKNKERKFKSPR